MLFVVMHNNYAVTNKIFDNYVFKCYNYNNTYF